MSIKNTQGLITIAGAFLLWILPSISAAQSAPVCWPDTAKSYLDIKCDSKIACFKSDPVLCATYKNQRSYQCVTTAAACTDGGLVATVSGTSNSRRATADGETSPAGKTAPAAAPQQTATPQAAPTGVCTAANLRANPSVCPDNSYTDGAGVIVLSSTNSPSMRYDGSGTVVWVAGGISNVGPGGKGSTTDRDDTYAQNGGGANGGKAGSDGNQFNRPDGYSVTTSAGAAASGGAGTPGGAGAPGDVGDDPTVFIGGQSGLNKDDQTAMNESLGGVQKQDEKQAANVEKVGSDENNSSSPGGCDKSSQLRMTCQGTRDIVTGAKITNQVGQLAGSAVVGATGSSSTQQALANGGSTADALLAAAQTQKTAAELQLSLGATNGALGVIQMLRASQASKNAKNLDSIANNRTYYKAGGGNVTGTSGQGTSGQYVSTIGQLSGANDQEGAYKSAYSNQQKNYQAAQSALNNGLGPAVYEKSLMNEASNQESTLTNNANSVMHKDIQAFARSAAAEQTNVGDTANAGGLQSLIAAGQQLAQGALNYAGAKQLESAANSIASANNGAATLTPPASDNFPTSATGATGATTITGNGVAANTSAATGSSGSTTGGDLGTPPPQTPAGTLTGNGGTPAPFNPSTGAGGSGGGGAAGLGGASTPAATPDNAVTNPTAAGNNTRTEYAGTDARPSGSGGGYSGAPASGLDLDKIAGMFKKEEGDKTPGNAAFRGGAYRDIASDNSVLGPDANLFHNVSVRYGTITNEQHL